MEPLEIQIIELNHKVDLLHQVVEKIALHITDLTGTEPEKESPLKKPLRNEPLKPAEVVETLDSAHLGKHKDILDDNTSTYSYEDGAFELAMSPEIQIRRLTAQLTAAYNRIAALEEQLLASRVHT